jgi:hypothetical protein
MCYFVQEARGLILLKEIWVSILETKARVSKIFEGHMSHLNYIGQVHLLKTQKDLGVFPYTRSGVTFLAREEQGSHK